MSDIYYQIQREFSRMVFEQFPQLLETEIPKNCKRACFIWWKSGTYNTVFERNQRSEGGIWAEGTGEPFHATLFDSALERFIRPYLAYGCSQSRIQPGDPWILTISPLSYHELAVLMDEAE